MTTDIRRGDLYLIDFDPPKWVKPKGVKPKAGSEIVKRSIMDALALS